MSLTTAEKIALISAAGTCVAALVGVASACVAVIALRRARSAEDGAKGYRATAEQQAKRATLAAEESASAQHRSAQAAEAALVAQRESVGAAERAANALEKQTQTAEDLAQAAERVPWRLEHRSGAMFSLWNESSYPKFGVAITGPGLSRNKTLPVYDRIDGRSDVEFWATTAHNSEKRVEVAWHNQEDRQDNQQSWSGTLPTGDPGPKFIRVRRDF